MIAIDTTAEFWHGAASFTHLLGACACATVGAMLAGKRERFGQAGGALVASLMLSAVWCLAVAVAGGTSLPSAFALGLRNFVWIVALYRLFASDGRHATVAPVRPVVFVLAAVAVLQPLALIIENGFAGVASPSKFTFHFNTMLAMLEVVGALVLVHNLYVGASSTARQVLRWPALALGIVWTFELNLYTVAWLSNRWPVPLAAVHGLVDIAFAATLALGMMEGREQLRLRPSRAVTFRSISLLIIGAYFIAMVAVAQWLADAGGDFARWLQFGFLIVGVACALLLLPSRRLRGWLRVTLTKHFFQHRYDYRVEWLRFTRTMGGSGGASGSNGPALPLHERAIQALADITDSPAGLLLLPDESRNLSLAARWQWPTAEVPPCAYPAEGIAFLEENDFIVDIDGTLSPDGDPRWSSDADGEVAIVPEWLSEDPRAWALVPLLHYERLVGAVVLARPPQARRLDWEDFDLLRVAGQQLASYLAEHSSQQALAEAGRFDDFHRRIAFVMHDIKNLASQFALLARNAERHAENPEFRADMLVTLRASADKLNALMARLSRYGTGAVDHIEAVDVGDVAREVVAGFAARHNVQVIARQAYAIAGNRHSLEQVLAHLVQNGIDASPADAAVFIGISADAEWCRIEVIDSGHGMSAAFIRNRLFRPFDSSKPGGFGIGAYEARELVRAMHGRLEVDSREGLGTRFVVCLPLIRADQHIDFDNTPDNKALSA